MIPPVGEEIRRARERQGLTITQAASARGVSRPAWSQWESGARGVSLDQLSRIADALDHDVVIRLVPKKP